MTNRSWQLFPLALLANFSFATSASENTYSTDCSPIALQANSLRAQQALQQSQSVRSEALVAAFCAKYGHSLNSTTDEDAEGVDGEVRAR